MSEHAPEMRPADGPHRQHRPGRRPRAVLAAVTVAGIGWAPAAAAEPCCPNPGRAAAAGATRPCILC